jgi:two-component system LytT family response regulator
MTALKAVIVDDERLSRRRLSRLLSQDPDLKIAGEYETGQQALPWMSEQSPDLLFLDIQMPGLDGFGLLESLGPNRIPCTIFVTAYDDHALRAFEVHAFDYLLKPFDETRLLETVKRAKQHLFHRQLDMGQDSLRQMLETMNRPERFRDRLAIKTGENVILIRTGAIDWIEAADNYVYLHCGSETHVLRETMNALERTLDPNTFLRIHRSAIVNLDRVKSLQPWFRGDYRVMLSTGAQLTLSRSYRQNLQNRVLKL